MSQAKVSDLLLYPIKGCRGYSVDQAAVTPMGLVGDREFAVIKDGERINQKQLSSMMYLSAVWKSAEYLELSFPGTSNFELNCAVSSIKTLDKIQVYGSDLSIQDMGDDVAFWLTERLGAEVRLARTNGATPWFLPVPEFVSVHGKPQTKFVDAAPILLTNTESLDDLNARLSDELPMNRFRPNIVVDLLEAYKEDSLEIFNFPSLNLESVAICERCTVTTTDQETGEVAKEPLRTLSKYRKRADGYAGGIMFGIYVTAIADGKLAIGDNLE